jgi:hypothetical protein
MLALQTSFLSEPTACKSADFEICILCTLTNKQARGVCAQLATLATYTARALKKCTATLTHLFLSTPPKNPCHSGNFK